MLDNKVSHRRNLPKLSQNPDPVSRYMVLIPQHLGTELNMMFMKYLAHNYNHLIHQVLPPCSLIPIGSFIVAFPG